MLHASPDVIEQVVVNLPNYILWLDSKGFFQGCNNNFAALVGLNSPKDIIGLTEDTLPFAKQLLSVHTTDEQLINTGDSSSFKKFNILLQEEHKHLLVEKKFIYDKNQGISNTIVVINDITEQENLRASLQHTVYQQKSYVTSSNKKVTDQEHRNLSVKECTKKFRNYLENIIAMLPGNMYWLNSNSVLLGGNTNLAKMFGLHSRAELAGLTYDRMTEFAQWTEGQGESFKQAELEVMASGIPRFNVEEPPVLINGEKRYYLSNKVPLYNQKNKIIGVLGISIDITDRKVAEQREKAAIIESFEIKVNAEEQLRQAVMILAGSIAHDLRTPICRLALISGSLKNYLPELINNYEKTKVAGTTLVSGNNVLNSVKDELVKKGDKINQIVQEMHDFINMTLKTLSKVVSGNLSQEDLVTCSMWHCINNTLQRYPFSEAQRALIQWDQADFAFMGNELLMIRVFFNLIKNSLEQIAEKNQGKIFITTEVKENANIIRFKDTAGGVPSEAAADLFTAYHTTKKEGTGIGLAFCKITMENLRGSINCHSVYGEYIEFILSFPLVKTGSLE